MANSAWSAEAMASSRDRKEIATSYFGATGAAAKPAVAPAVVRGFLFVGIESTSAKAYHTRAA
jgi:hypothetical protein